ncbi:MAG: DinB family protein [Bacteroidota bacterium]
MNYNLNDSINFLRRTPSVLNAYLRNVPAQWTNANEGGETWSPFDVVGHLIHGEKTDWVVRIRIILDHGTSKPFEPFDRFAQLQNSQGKSMNELLDEFEKLRVANIEALQSLDLGDDQLDLTGLHPDFQSVTIRQLLATWTIHDMGHISQISRVMASQYKEAVGPWYKYLKILH